MQTNRAKICPRLKLSVAKLAPVVAACAALAAVVPARGVDYLWDGTGSWDLGSWRFNAGTVNWSSVTPLTQATAVFSGAGGNVAIDAAIQLNGLRFSTGNYSLNAGTDGSLEFLGVAPQVTIADGVSTTFNVGINGGASDGTLIFNGKGTFVFGRSDLFDDFTAIDLQGGTMNIQSYTDTVAGFTLSAGGTFTGDTGTLTADNYRLINGTVDGRLGAGTISVSGPVIVTANGHFDSSSALNVSGTLTLNSYQTVAAVKLTNGSISGGTLHGDSYAVARGEISANLTGVGDLTKSTAGTVILSGVNNYTGATTISQGSLVLDGGSLVGSNAAAVTVSSGAIFAGYGTASRAVVVSGTISPGIGAGSTRVGTLSTSSQTWNGGGTYAWDIANVSGVAGTDWDLLKLNGGNLSINSIFNLKVIGLVAAGFDSTTSYGWLIAGDVLSYSGNLSSVAITGTPAVGSFSLDYRSSGVYLDYTPVPEPKDYAMILGAITLGLVGYRRWRRTEQLA